MTCLSPAMIRGFFKLFVDGTILRTHVQVTCFRCGVKWPYDAPELCCTCAPNDVSRFVWCMNIFPKMLSSFGLSGEIEVLR